MATGPFRKMTQRLARCALVALALVQLATGQLMSCPQVCSCIWRNGKQTTICENQNLISIPNQISPSTQVLDLNTNNFHILPSKAFQERGLINLQKLFLPRCKLGAIADDAFVQLTNLVELDLSDNLLTQVPLKALANATNLRRLLLNNNHIATINAESFATLNNLKFLNLSGCQTHTIEPRAFFGLHDLEYLYLHSNHLTTLPYGVVADLPALYSFDLYRNPWLCNCEMRATREWMMRNNVGQSIPPTCELPLRLSGLMWNSLDLDDFACEPDIITTTVEVTRTIGTNATLICTVKGLPEPKVFWYTDDTQYRNLSSLLPHDAKYHVTEERTEGTVQSVLTIIDVNEADHADAFTCSAENRAGIKSKNFTVFVVPSAFGVPPNWSKMDTASSVLVLFIATVAAFIVIILVLVKTKKFHKSKEDGDGSSGDDAGSLDKKPSHLNLLKHGGGGAGGATVYPMTSGPPYGSALQQHLSMLGLDGIDKKPEIFLNTNLNPMTAGPPPDLVQGGAQQHLVNGYEMNLYSNGGALPYAMMRHSMDTENEAIFCNDPPYYLGPSGPYQPHQQDVSQHQQQQHQQQQQQQQQQQYLARHSPDTDGLYRAVMVPPSVITTSTSSTSTSSSNTGHGCYMAGQQQASGGGSGSATSAPRSSPFMHLSASNLYTQYAMSQYDLSQPPARISPYQYQAQYGVPGGHQEPLVYGNPGFVCSTNELLDAELYAEADSDSVFRPNEPMGSMYALHPSSPSLVYTNGSHLTGYHGYHASQYAVQHHHGGTPPMQMAPPAPTQQPIYGVATKRWTSGTATPASLVPNMAPATTATTLNVRCSPDEGYGEESSSGPSVGQLEGTEV